jgi:hypothetical protein
LAGTKLAGFFSIQRSCQDITTHPQNSATCGCKSKPAEDLAKDLVVDLLNKVREQYLAIALAL